MSKPQNDQISLLMQGDWSKAFVALNNQPKDRLEKAKKRFRWLRLILPKVAAKNLLH
jgi:hypothetical protein